MREGISARHSGESRNPGFQPFSKSKFKDWIPAFAGMTMLLLFVWPSHSSELTITSVTLPAPSPQLYLSSVSTHTLRGRLIVIDPGHGVINYDGAIINPGKISNSGLMEHKLNMEIAQRLGKRLEKEGAKVIFTRTPSDYWRESYGTIEDNKNRSAFANELKADVFLAIHCDWDPRKRVHGITTIYAKPESRRLGELVHRSLLKGLHARDHKLVLDTYTVLDNINVPGLIVECGFLSHREESRKLIKPTYQTQIADAITKALKSYFETGS
jgi:N-acetylmuramoyl-L-alanine amidase